LWTSENTGKKDDAGKNVKAFTSVSAFVNGLEAEWLAKSVKKGSLVFVTGTGRIDKFTKQDGTDSHSILISRVGTARCLDEKEDASAQTKPAETAPGTRSTAAEEDSPPFSRSELESLP
jgi:single-stranded DNA-binding protein